MADVVDHVANAEEVATQEAPEGEVLIEDPYA